MHYVYHKFSRKKLTLFFFILASLIYLIFAFIRPLEEDESHYIMAGKAILEGNLNPFQVLYYKHYLNPFQYIMGSPLVPVIYGGAYILGGIILARLVALFSVLSSVIIAIAIVRKLNGDYIVPLILVSFSSATILLASDGYLDSVALFFMMCSLYFAVAGRKFYSGLAFGLAAISKFVLVIPAVIFILYYLFRHRSLKFLFGCLAVAVPFLILYKELLPVLAHFVFSSKINVASFDNAKIFLKAFIFNLPLVSIGLLIFSKSEKIRGNLALLIPTLSILAFHIITLDYNALVRHLPYAEFPAAILIGLAVSGKKIKYVWIILVLYSIVGLNSAFSDLVNYPSYNLIEDELAGIGGKILAVNMNSFMLIKGMPFNSTAENVFGYYWFNYDEEYESALKDGYFDYALISSVSPYKFRRYQLIESLVRKYYCPVAVSEGKNGIDIYRRCN